MNSTTITFICEVLQALVYYLVLQHLFLNHRRLLTYVEYWILILFFMGVETVLVILFPYISMLIHYADALIFSTFILHRVFQVSLRRSISFFVLVQTFGSFLVLFVNYILVPLLTRTAHSPLFYYLSSCLTFLPALALAVGVFKTSPLLHKGQSPIILLPCSCVAFTLSYLQPSVYRISPWLAFVIDVTGLIILTIFLSGVILYIHHEQKTQDVRMTADLHAQSLAREYSRLSREYTSLRMFEHDIKNELLTIEILQKQNHQSEACRLAESLLARIKSGTDQEPEKDPHSPLQG